MEIDAFVSFTIGILVLFVGRSINAKVRFLQDYNIPEPVTGGLLFSLLFALGYIAFDVAPQFDLVARDALLLYFFTGIGLNSDFRTLLAGGKPLLVLLIATLGYMILQNIVGISLAEMMELPKHVGLLTGTVSLIGGHGTTIAWAPTFAQDYGIENAAEIGVAAATVGLVLAGLLGGPIAHYLIRKHQLEPKVIEQPDFGVTYDKREARLDHYSVLYAWLTLNVALIIGVSLNEGLEQVGFKLPMFVTCLFAGILLTNTVPLIFKNLDWPSRSLSLGLISEIALGVFLAMSLMSLQLWALVDLALPMIVILITQLVATALVAVFVVFKIMGRDYEAAVASAGFAGYGLGATPTAIANMSAVTKKFGAAHKAFIIVPLVGAFFIDIANAFIIRFFLSP